MYRAEPVFNKRLINQWQQQNYGFHRRKLEDIEQYPNRYRSYSQSAPRPQNRKRKQKMAEETERIARDNRILLQKMADIIYIVVLIGFFGLTAAYARSCERI